MYVAIVMRDIVVRLLNTLIACGTNTDYILYQTHQAAELDCRVAEMTNEPLNQIQLGHIRIYHATCLFADAVPEVIYGGVHWP